MGMVSTIPPLVTNPPFTIISIKSRYLFMKDHHGTWHRTRWTPQCRQIDHI